MSSLPVFGLLAFAAVLNAALLGIALVRRARGTPVRWLGWILLGAGYLLAIYSLERYDQIAIDGWVRISYDLVSLLLACLLLEFVHESVRHGRPHRLIYLPIAAYLLLLAAFRGKLFSEFTINRLVLVQSLYTATAVAILGRWMMESGRGVAGSLAWRISAVVTSIFLAVHLAHLFRVLLQNSARVDAAPMVAVVAMIGAAGFMFSHGNVLGRSPGRPRLGAKATRELIESLRTAMEERRVFTDPALDLAGLAETVGSSAKNVSDALNRELGRSFYDFVTAYRVEEAKKLLRDPDRAHLSLEAVGEEAGFRSRSSFYSAFKDAAGQTPGDFRRSPGS